MNKELIKKYKVEFEHWLNEGKILVKLKNDSSWYPEGHSVFNWAYPENIKHIIINDEYVEFRKALAEGKTLQFDYRFHNEWCDIPPNECKFSGALEQYRIKPEPKFKVGDYMCNTKASGHGLFKVTQEWLKHIELYGKTVRGNTVETGELEDFKLWTFEEARDDEWVVCLRPASVPILITKKQFNIQKDNFLVFESVVPYIGQTIEELGIEG